MHLSFNPTWVTKAAADSTPEQQRCIPQYQTFSPINLPFTLGNAFPIPGLTEATPHPYPPGIRPVFPQAYYAQSPIPWQPCIPPIIPQRAPVIDVSLSSLKQGSANLTCPNDVVRFVCDTESEAALVDELRKKRFSELENSQAKIFGKEVPSKATNEEGKKEPVIDNLGSKNHRLVYQSILRNMLAHTTKNRAGIIKKLMENGYDMITIERCINKIGTYSTLKCTPENSGRYKDLFEKMVQRKMVYAHILAGTLREMLETEGENKKRTSKVAKLRKEICHQLLGKATDLLDQAS